MLPDHDPVGSDAPPPRALPLAEPPREALPPAALVVRRLNWVVTALVITTISIALDIVVRRSDVDPAVPVAVLPILFGLIVLGWGMWWSRRVHDSWSFQLTDDRLRVQSGVVVQRVGLLPRSRVQHVSTDQGPIQRHLDLTAVTIHTAGARTPNVRIPHVRVADGERLRSELIE